MLSEDNKLTVTVYYTSLTNYTLYTSLDIYLQPFESIRTYKVYLFDSKLGLDSLASYPSKYVY